MADKPNRRRRSRSGPHAAYQIDEIFHGMMLQPSRGASLSGRRDSEGCWRPAIDVYEVDGVLNIVADLAGVREDQVHVALDEKVLHIRGERAPMNSDPNRSVHEIGIQYGPFAADIYLPYSVNHERVEAVYENGMLRIQLRKTDPTQISVNYIENEK